MFNNKRKKHLQRVICNNNKSININPKLPKMSKELLNKQNTKLYLCTHAEIVGLIFFCFITSAYLQRVKGKKVYEVCVCLNSLYTPL